jgi:type 1 fimbria pilin
MKKKLLIVSLATVMNFGVLNTSSAANSVTFTGTIQPTLCVLSINGRGLESDVVFEDIMKKDLAVGTVASPVNVGITISNCPAAAIDSTKITFSGAKSSTTDSFVVNTEDLDSGLVVELKDAEGTLVVPNTANSVVIEANKNNQFAYTANLRVLNDNIPLGHFDTTTTVSVAYE